MFGQKLTPLEKVEFLFAEKVNGFIWKTIVDASKNRLFIECRNTVSKTVTFAALDLEKKKWQWKDIAIDEPWWVSLAGSTADMLLLSVYNEPANPARTSLVAFDVTDKRIVWWKNNFVLETIHDRALAGVDASTGLKKMIRASDGIDLPKDSFIGEPQNLTITRPFQYQEGSPYFETVGSFLKVKCNISAVAVLEYVEFGPFSVVSAFTHDHDLANYLIVCNAKGDVLVNESLGEHLKGIAQDTFFIFSGYLIFVKNKSELVIYKFV